MENIEVKPNIQDFIIAVNDKADKKIGIYYDVVLENSCDFIISRKTAKTERILAVIISQGLYYIKDNNTGETIKLNYENGKTFFKDLRDSYITLKEVKWLGGINRDNFNRIMTVISDSTYVELCKHNLFFQCRNMEDHKKYAQADMKFFEYIFNNIPNVENTYKYDLDFIEFAYIVKKELGVNEARFFVDKYIISSINSFNNGISNYRHDERESIFFLLIKKPEYNLEFRRFIEYVLFDIYAQGKNNLHYKFWQSYRDYLDMQIDVYGTVKEKYPKHFETEHDIITLKHNLMKFQIEEEKFNKQMQKYKDLEFADKKYLIRVPEKSEELIEEGKKLNHCVGSYGPRIASGDCGVVFLRRRDSERESFITIEIVNDKVRQMQGAEKRKPNYEEMEFLRKWAYEKCLKIAV